MRTIKFRGKSIDDRNPDEWVYGYFSADCTGDECRIGDIYEEFLVDGATIGQFTGLLDRNGKEVYEGDILAFVGSENPKAFFVAVKWRPQTACFYLERISCPEPNDYGPHAHCYTLEGNIYDNPELLKNNKDRESSSKHD